MVEDRFLSLFFLSIPHFKCSEVRCFYFEDYRNILNLFSFFSSFLLSFPLAFFILVHCHSFLLSCFLLSFLPPSFHSCLPFLHSLCPFPLPSSINLSFLHPSSHLLASFFPYSVIPSSLPPFIPSYYSSIPPYFLYPLPPSLTPSSLFSSFIFLLSPLPPFLPPFFLSSINLSSFHYLSSFLVSFFPSFFSFLAGLTARRLKVFQRADGRGNKWLFFFFSLFLPIIYSFFPPLPLFFPPPLSLSLDGGRLGALAAQRGLQQQLHVKLASPHSLQCNSSLLRRGKVICL